MEECRQPQKSLLEENTDIDLIVRTFLDLGNRGHIKCYLSTRNKIEEVLSYLQERDFICDVQPPHDPFVAIYHVNLTPKGQELYNQIYKLTQNILEPEPKTKSQITNSGPADLFTDPHFYDDREPGE